MLEGDHSQTLDPHPVQRLRPITLPTRPAHDALPPRTRVTASPRSNIPALGIPPLSAHPPLIAGTEYYNATIGRPTTAGTTPSSGPPGNRMSQAAWIAIARGSPPSTPQTTTIALEQRLPGVPARLTLTPRGRQVLAGMNREELGALRSSVIAARERGTVAYTSTMATA